MKLTITEARRRIAQLEAEVERLTPFEVDPANALNAWCAAQLEHVPVPERTRYVGDPISRCAADKLKDALEDMIAEYWDTHAVRAVFDLCERAGERPASMAPSDIEEAADTLLHRYPR